MKVKFKVPACLSPACARGVGWCSLKRKSCQDQPIVVPGAVAHIPMFGHSTCPHMSGPIWLHWWHYTTTSLGKLGMECGGLGGLGGQNVHVTKYGKCTAWWCWWAPACNSVLWWHRQMSWRDTSLLSAPGPLVNISCFCHNNISDKTTGHTTSIVSVSYLGPSPVVLVWWHTTIIVTAPSLHWRDLSRTNHRPGSPRWTNDRRDRDYALIWKLKCQYWSESPHQDRAAQAGGGGSGGRHDE